MQWADNNKGIIINNRIIAYTNATTDFPLFLATCATFASKCCIVLSLAWTL